ncbi:putative amino acid transporter [Trypanosoma cruzi]|nr:putative amino acid transporter [Trypanosoma cruzi]
MHHSITDEGIHLFGTGNRALDGLGVFMFAFLCQVNSFEVYWDMSDRSASRFTLCSAIAMLLCFIVYGSTAVFGYLDFGNRATVSALLLYNPVKEPEVMVAYIGLLVKLCASFPLISMATRNSLYHSVGGTPTSWHSGSTASSSSVLPLLHCSSACSSQYQHGVWLHWLILWRCNGFSSSLDFMMYGGNWSLRSVGWAHYTITYALLLPVSSWWCLAQVPPSTALWRETECGAVWSSGTIARPWTPASVRCASAVLCCGMGTLGAV